MKSVPFDEGFKERLKDSEYAFEAIRALSVDYERDIDTLETKVKAQAELLERVKVLEDAMEKMAKAWEWKEREEPMNFCTDDCPNDCSEHTAYRKQKYRTLMGGDLAVKALTRSHALGESKDGGKKE